MKYKIGLITALSLTVGNVHAQSSVTLYGVVDAAVRFTTNQATSNGPKNQVVLAEGPFNGGRWGLRGTEDLGAGYRGIFALESGFQYDTGKSSQQGQLFGRQAWIGLSSKTLGTVKLGRQYGSAQILLWNFDPVFTSNFNEIGWEYGFPGVRFDNTIEYTNQWGGLGVNAQYSMGEQAGQASRGRTFQGGTTYETGNLMLGAAAQQSTDASGKDMRLWEVGARYAIGTFTLLGYYIDSRRDAGFVIGTGGTTAPLANTSLISNSNTIAGPNTQTTGRHDRVGVLGFTYRPESTPWSFYGAYMRDNAVGVSRGASGIIQSIYAIAMYSLSKRTDVYVEADTSRLSGAALTDPNSPLGNFGGASTRTGVGLGFRTKF